MNKRILVIDDDQAVRESFTLALEDTVWPVDTAESGEKGLEALQAREYGLIFLDLKMPGIDGAETLRQLRRMGMDAPVYIVTAFHREFFDQLKGLWEDGIDFELLKKPVSADQIILLTTGVFEGPTGKDQQGCSEKKSITMCEFKLYVVDSTPSALKAIASFKNILEADLKDDYSLEVIDVPEKLGVADSDKIFATPTAVKVPLETKKGNRR